MAFSASVVHPVAKTNSGTVVSNNITSSLLSLIILSAYAAKKSSKSFRKMKRHLMWNVFKYKMTALFSRQQGDISTKTLLYILVGVLFIVLLIISPIAALVLAILVLILFLAGIIKF